MGIRLADIREGDRVVYVNGREQIREVKHVSYKTGMLALSGRNHRLHFSKVKALLEKKDA